MIIAQVCLRLTTIKGHSKMCSFTVLGGGGGVRGVRKPVSITHLLRIELIRLLIVACGMLVHSSSMAVRSCWILAGTGTQATINNLINSMRRRCVILTGFRTPRTPPPPPNTVKLHILEWSFIVVSLRHTCAIIMLSNQHLDMPHLWGGWIISAKEKCSLTQI